MQIYILFGKLNEYVEEIQLKMFGKLKDLINEIHDFYQMLNLI